ncbi:carboxymuconolactone decarboxylase family protein [Rhodoferax sp. UBA5149]|uniref:carboxymuconolactone decarboxylase family protein n=1 Tax=Rhodoferax sp. UBA5149 TaxID=1947379 RepID=UPI0025E7A8FA|nr:carboxymuconolactone decarboxylase family protein [Rhodoferax sp. UBA5149]
MPNTETPMDNSNYQAGLDQLRRIEATDRPSIIDSLSDIAPDLARLAISFVYGQIYTRPHLNLRDRQLVTVAMLAALGNARPQLKFHIAGALNVGCSATEIIELMLHLAVYAGFPAGLNGVFAAKEVFEDRGLVFATQAVPPPVEAERFRKGWDALMHIDGHAGEQVIASLADVAPDLGRFIIEFGFGDIYTRPGLDLLQRELITVAALTALGTAAPQLKVHVHGLLNVGGTREQLIETVIHVAAYAGFPAAINAMLTVKEVLAQRETEQLDPVTS